MSLREIRRKSNHKKKLMKLYLSHLGVFNVSAFRKSIALDKGYTTRS